MNKSKKSFEKIEDKKASTYVIEQIVGLIREGVYKTGDKLPPEKEIAAKTGISRPSVREAITSLQVIGVIETKPGKGSYVKSPLEGESVESEAIALLQEEEINPFEVLVARQKIEPIVSEMVLDNLENSDLVKIEQCMKKMKKTVKEGDCDAYFANHWKFHSSIAQATKNRVIGKIMDSLLNVIKDECEKQHVLWREILALHHQSEDKLRESYEDHHLILSALRKGDKQLLKKGFRQHFENMSRRLELS